MKKFARILLAILMIAALALAITACKSDCDKGNHAWDEGAVTKAATCAEEGVKTFKCTLCDEEKTEPIAKLTTHTPVSAAKAATCTEDGIANATKCSVCGTAIEAGTKIDKLGHNVTAWTPVANDSTKHEGTCTREGCGAKVTADHTPVVGDDTPATCTTDGKKGDTTCSDCNATIATGEAINKLGHNFDATIAANVTDKVDATCTVDGTMKVKCSRCDATENQTIPATGHTMKYVITDDSHSYKCSACDLEDAEKAGAHVYENGSCVCGKMHTDNFDVTDLNTVKESVGSNRYYVIGKITEMSGTNLTIADESGTTLYLYTVWTSEGKYYNSGFPCAVGDVIVVWGSVSTHDNAVQMTNPRLVEHKGTAMTTPSDLALTQITCPTYVNKDFALYTADGLTWTVSEGNCTIDNNTAKVTPSDSLQEVKLTASVTLKGVTKTKDFVVKVSPVGTGVIELDFTADIDGLTGESGDQNFTVNGIEYTVSQSKDGGTYLMMYSSGNAYIANKTALPGSIVSLTFVKTSGSSAGTEYYLNVGASAILSNTTTGTKFTKEPLSSTKEFDAAAGYTYFNISIASKNGQLERIIIIYRDCEHQVESKDALTATCAVPGYAAHYECTVCGDWFSDAQGATPIEKTYNVVSHTFANADNHHESVAATCTQDGNIEYYVCDVCGHYFKADKTTEITAAQTVIEAIGHDYTNVAFVDDENGTTHSQVCKNDATHKNTENHSTQKTAWEIGATEHYRICEVCGAQYDNHAHDYSNGDCACGAKDVVRHAVTFTVSITGGAKVIRSTDDNDASGLSSIAVEDTQTCEFKIVLTDGYTLNSVIVGDSTIPLVADENGIYAIANVTGALSVTIDLTAPAKSWKLITSQTDFDALFSNGDTTASILIVANEQFVNVTESGTNQAALVGTATIENDSITPATDVDVYAFTIEKVGNIYRIKSNSGYYIGHAGTSNNISSTDSIETDSTTYDNIVVIDADGTTHIVSGDSYTAKSSYEFMLNGSYCRYYKGTQSTYSLYVLQ